jgi:hypothetical protein
MLRQDESMVDRETSICTAGQNIKQVKNTNGLGTIGRGICHNWFDASDLAVRSAQDTEKKILIGLVDVL